MNRQNPQGHTWTAYYTFDSACCAKQLLDCNYLGGGVVSCRKGFTQGLFNLETGQWLYQESVFSNWQAEDDTYGGWW